LSFQLTDLADAANRLGQCSQLQISYVFLPYHLNIIFTFEKYSHRALHCSKRNVYLCCLAKERSEK